MLVMGLDTSLQRCSVAILKNGALLAAQSKDLEKGHAEHLAPMAAAALSEAAISIRALDRVGVVVGPGGFSGVRVGLSFARGLAIGADLDVVGVTSLAALARNLTEAPPSALIAPLIDARRGQLYAGLYEQSGAVLAPPFVASPDDVFTKLKSAAQERPVSLIGTGAALMAQEDPCLLKPKIPMQIDARNVALLAAVAAAPSASPAPLYLRAPDAKPPKSSRFEGLSAP